MSAVKIALLSDIHGNLTALDAVLQDIDNLGGADHYLVLGDLAALGPQPVQVLERLNQLPNVQFARGNTDRYLFSGERPTPTIAQTAKDPALIPILYDVATTFAWTQGIITQAGWFDWLQNLPFEIRLILPDGTRLLGVHAAPKADDISIHPNLSNEEIDSHVNDCQADLICMGHTHIPLNVHVGNRHVVNLGSVSLSLGSDLRASYVFLTADSTTYQLQHRQVAYDYQAVIDTLHRVHHPGRTFIISHFKNRQ